MAGSHGAAHGGAHTTGPTAAVGQTAAVGRPAAATALRRIASEVATGPTAAAAACRRPGRTAGWTAGGEIVERVAAEAERAAADAGAAAEALTASAEELSALRRARQAADAERSAAHRGADAARTAAEHADAAHREATAVRDALAGDPRLAALLGVEEIVPDTDASALVERLAAALDAAEQERTAVLAEQARDQRALRALGEGGLLPEPAEIEDVLRVLEAAGITAYSGWRYLAMLPAEARTAVVERLPHLVGGVLLNNAADAARARAELASARLLPCAVVAVGATAAVASDGVAPGIEFVVPPNPAMVDEDAAAEVRAELTGATHARSADLERLTSGLDRDRDLLARVRTWRDRRPTVGELADAADAAAVRSTETAARAESADAPVAELDARAESLEADRPRLAAAAVTTRERAAELAGLAAETGRAPALRDRARSAAADAARAEAQAAAARAEGAQAREAADAARRREDRHTGVAERARAELADLPLDSALDNPTDSALDLPLDSAHDNPTESALGRPAESALGRPAESALGRPAESALGRPAESALGRPAESALGRPAESAFDNPTESALGSPAESALGGLVDSARGGLVDSALDDPRDEPRGDAGDGARDDRSDARDGAREDAQGEAREAGGGPVGVSEAQKVGLSVLRGAYAQACATYAAAEVGADLSAQLGMAERDARGAQGRVDGLDAAARAAAEALLRSPDAADPAARRAAADQARVELARADARRQEAATATALGRRELAGFTAAPRSVAPYGVPTDPADGQERIDRAEQDRRAAEDAATGTARVARDAVRQRDAVAASAEGFGHVVRGLDGSAADPAAEDPVPFAGDVAAAVEATAAARAALAAAAGERARADREVRSAVDAVAQFAQEPRFGTLTSPVRKHISGVARADMPALAGDWAAALRPRLRSLEDDLAGIGRHHAGIVTRLGGMVGQALRTLRLAQRLSELPDGLADWSGQQFLRIRFDDLDEAALRHALGEVVDRTAEQQVAGKSAGRRDGMALLLAGVRAAMPKGVRVEMLKPDAVLRTERLRVAQIRDVFSGGQRLTAAIVLYCTMAALRAHQRGDGRRSHAGVLFLDNPIGRASASYLLELQFGVARALGVQLVYTTGLFDAGALNTFPLIIRLRNDADLRAGRKYLSVDAQIATALDALAEPDGSGRVDATRVFRRPALAD